MIIVMTRILVGVVGGTGVLDVVVNNLSLGGEDVRPMEERGTQPPVDTELR